MAVLSVSDYRALDASALMLHGGRQPQTLQTRLQAALSALVPAEVMLIDRFDASFTWTGRVFVEPEQQVAPLFKASLRPRRTHRLLRRFAPGKLPQLACTSSLVRLGSLHEEAIYSDQLKPLGIDHQLGVTLNLRLGSRGVLMLGRKGKAFSDLDKLRLTTLVPHIEQAMLAAESVRDEQVDGIYRRSEGPLATIARPTLRSDLGISKREAEVLGWLAHGKTDAQIAAICDLAERTVQKHCENIYRKLGVECRTAAVMQALECIH